ncbi:MAG: lipopolysaccharide transport periplasmic protein LptA [Colwellia sp.]|nr:lipopolysaccharide transport periplasmic protein LptA [Colwellia sp.]
MNVLFIKNMMKANLNPSTLKVIALTCSLFLFSSAHGAKEDLEQEITIKSQRQSADLKNKIASYLDNVSIQQGSISITADIVKVFSSIDKNSGEKTDTYLAKGNPAVFQQKLEDGSLIRLQADEITYIPNANTITISGNALVKQAGSEVSGNEITYNTLSEKLEAQGSDNQSVTTILQPTILKKQKDTHEKSKAEKKGDGSDN